MHSRTNVSWELRDVEFQPTKCPFKQTEMSQYLPLKKRWENKKEETELECGEWRASTDNDDTQASNLN